jgi:voltage-gated potassium channel Kch
MKEYIKYKYDQFISLGTFPLIVILFIILFSVTFILTLIMKIAYPEFTIFELFWMTFMHTIDPGTLGGDDMGNISFLLVMAFVTFVGIFIFSLFVSFILTGFQDKLENLKKGRSLVFEKNHTLILGFDDGIEVVISELVEANENHKSQKIVVLSEKDPIEVNNYVKTYITDFKTTKVIYRHGNKYNVNDLKMCNIEQAKAVIIMGNDMDTIKTLLAIKNTAFYKDKINSDLIRGSISSIFKDKDNLIVAQSIAKNQGRFIHLKDAITRIIAQSCLQPGLGYVYNDLFDFDGDEIYFVSGDKLIGRTFLEAQKAYIKSIVLGFHRDGVTMIHPANDAVIQSGDLMIVITEDDDTDVIKVYEEQNTEEHIVKTARKSQVTKQELLFIGFNKKVCDVIKETTNYLEEGSVIKVLVRSDLAVEQLTKLNEQLPNITIEVIKGMTHSRPQLKHVTSPHTKSIVLFANDDLSKTEADSNTLLSILHLREIDKESDELLFDIIAEIADVKDEEIITLANVDDFVISDLLANKMLTQIAENASLLEIFDYLLSEEGSEIYIKDIEDYVVLDQEVNFYTLIDACAVKNEIALGYKLNTNEGNNSIVMNPVKDEMIRFSKGDKIIVLSED